MPEGAISAARGCPVRVGCMSKPDRDYYLARIAAERAAAERATNEDARQVHLQLIDEYQELLDGHDRKAPPSVED